MRKQDKAPADKCQPHGRLVGFPPETSRNPENRHGTRTARAYLLHHIKGNCRNCSRLVAATPCQYKKVRKWMDATSDLKAVPKGWGPTMRAILRDNLANWYDFDDIPF